MKLVLEKSVSQNKLLLDSFNNIRFDSDKIMITDENSEVQNDLINIKIVIKKIDSNINENNKNIKLLTNGIKKM